MARSARSGWSLGALALTLAGFCAACTNAPGDYCKGGIEADLGREILGPAAP